MEGSGCACQVVGKETDKKLVKPFPAVGRVEKFPVHYREIQGKSTCPTKDPTEYYMNINETL